MNRETDTVFLQTVGKFIVAQVQLAMYTVNREDKGAG